VLVLAGAPALLSPAAEADGPLAHLRTGSATVFHTGHQGGEVSLGITSTGSVFFAGADMTPDQSSVRVVRTSDGGASWSSVWPTSPDQTTDYPLVIDPYVHVDTRTGRVFSARLVTPCTLITTSDDDGRSWTPEVPACGVSDRESVTTGRPTTSTLSAYPDVVYVCGTDLTGNVGSCIKSVDGGQTFQPTGSPAYPPRYESDLSCQGTAGDAVTGPDGALYLPKIWCGGRLTLAVSRDEGATWRLLEPAGGSTAAGVAQDRFEPPLGLPNPAVPDSVVTRASVAVDETGGIYYVWAGRDRRAYLTASKDGGATWSAPLAVSPSDVNETFNPVVAVGRPGEVAISFLGSTNSPGTPFLLSSYTDAVTWGGYVVAVDLLRPRPALMTAQVNAPGHAFVLGACGPTRCGADWDFQDVQVDAEGNAWASFVDQCFDGDCHHIGVDKVTPTAYGETVIAKVPLRTR
jgi:hypothetical protein